MTWSCVKNTMLLAASKLHADIRKVAIHPESAICLLSELSYVPLTTQMSIFLNIALVLSNSLVARTWKSESVSLISQWLNALMQCVSGENVDPPA